MLNRNTRITPFNNTERRRSSRIEDKMMIQDTIQFDVLKSSHTYNTRKRRSSPEEKNSNSKIKLTNIEEIKDLQPFISSIEKSFTKECRNICEEKIETSELNLISLKEEARNIQAVLNRNLTEVLPGRENQMEELHKILLDCSKNKKSVSMYISGCPGSGKTITIKLLLSRSDITHKFKKVFINCMDIRNNGDVYKEIVNNLEKSSDSKDNKVITIEKIEKTILKMKKPALIILDEMDVLSTKNSVLHSLFELTSRLPSGKITLIGVGNTLDFVEKNLPFSSFKNIITFQFPSYDQYQISEIIFQRIKSVNAKQLMFSEPAIKLLAGKVASFGGDARAALGIASSAIYYVLENIENDSSDQILIVNPQTILAVTGSIYDTVERFQSEKKPVSSSFQLDGFPLHQKLILCSLVLVLKKKTCVSSQLNMQKIREMYKTICQQKFIDILNQTDFNNTCSLIEMNGIFSLGKGKNGSKVILKWDKNEMMNALSKEIFFGDILRNNL